MNGSNGYIMQQLRVKMVRRGSPQGGNMSKKKRQVPHSVYLCTCLEFAIDALLLY